MKLFETLSPSARQDRQEVKQKQQNEYKKIGYLKHQNGHTLYSYNTNTHEWKVAEIQKTAYINFDKSVVKKAKVNIEKDCVYIEALNLKNAKKRLARYVKEMQTS